MACFTHLSASIVNIRRFVRFLFIFSSAAAWHFLFAQLVFEGFLYARAVFRQGSCVFSLVLIATCWKIRHRSLSRVSVRCNWPHRRCSLNSGTSFILSVQDQSIAVPFHFVCSPVRLPIHAFRLTITCLETERRHQDLRISHTLTTFLI